jgi:hypothetical protein
MVMPALLHAQKAAPLTVTRGVTAEPPALPAKAFAVHDTLESVAVPLDGWKVVWPGLAPGQEQSVTSGVAISRTNVVIRGALVPALRMVCTKGSFRSPQPVVELDWPFNAETHNLLSFIGKVEVDDGLLPLTRDSQGINTGWFSATFNRYFDTFGVAVDDGHYQWAAGGVPTTHFHFHDFPESRGADGYADFIWDMKYQDHTGNKGFARDRARALRFHYDTRKIPEGKRVVITIAQPKLTRGAHIVFDEPARYASWTNYVANYTPDYSDSTAHYGPPESGRLARPVRITENGQAKAEVVVDYSEAIRIDNFFTDKAKWNMELKAARGHEVPVARRATRELVEWTKKLTGADLPVVLAPTAAKSVKIFLGATFAKPHFAGDLAALTADPTTDGYAIRVKDGNIYIFGARPAGTLFGVCAFIENNSDLIWASGDPLFGTVYTERPTLDVVWADVLERPAFIQRGCSGDESWRVRNSMNFPGSTDSGMFATHGGHYLCPQYYDNAEGLKKFNAMINGKRPEKWSEYYCLACLEDPEFLPHATETVPNVKHIRYGSVRGTLILGTDDNYGVCECPLCTRPFTNAVGRVISPDTDYLAHYGIWFYRYLNKVDDEIQKVWPGFVTSTYAYFFASPYPEIPVNKTISPQLCLYVRKSMNEPVFAPANQHWWKYYNDWARHTDTLMHYDYYNLGFILKPHADVHKFDLQAQRDIGYLRNYSEGFSSNEYLGAAGERWVMARLKWNPDQDTEQLHRRYNRRTYREAAPWMDKFRGTIREAVYKRGNRSWEFEETHDMANIFNDLGLTQTLKGYLDEALKAARHPSSKALIERAVADYDHYVVKYQEERGFPSREMNQKAATDAKAVIDPVAAAFQQRDAKAFDGTTAIWRSLGSGNHFDLVAPAARAAESETVFVFAVNDGSFALNGAPAVSFRNEKNEETACQYTWKDNGNGTWTATVRYPSDAGDKCAFRFRFIPAEPKINWDGTVEFKLLDIALAKRGGGTLDAPARPLVNDAEFKDLLLNLKTNGTDRLAAAATNAANAAVRLASAVGAAPRRGFEPFVDVNVGKMKSCGALWAAALQRVVERRIRDQEYAGAIPLLREQLAYVKPNGHAEWIFPSIENLAFCLGMTGAAAEVPKLVDGLCTGLDTKPGSRFQILRSAVSGLARSGSHDLAIELFKTAMGDRRIGDDIRMRFMNEHFFQKLIESPRSFPVERLVPFIREYADDWSKQQGWTPAMAGGGFTGRFSPIADYYVRHKRDYASAARIWEIGASWDGDRAPVGLRHTVVSAAKDFMRNQLKQARGDLDRKTADHERRAAAVAAAAEDRKAEAEKAAADAKVARDAAQADYERCKIATDSLVDRWKQSLRLVVSNGSSARERGGALLNLLGEEWESRSHAARQTDIDQVILDEYQHPDVRKRAAMLITRLYSQPASTNWAAAADHVVRSVEAGDWSNNGRNSYFRGRNGDNRLDVVETVARGMLAQGQNALAKSLLERSAGAMGYYAGYTFKNERGTGEADYKARTDRLDALMGRCGATRPSPPAAKK